MIVSRRAKTYSRSTRRGQCVDTEIKNFRRRFQRKVWEAVVFELPGLQKVWSSLKEVGNHLTRAYFPSRSRFSLG